MSDFIIDKRNSNRYRIVVKESVGNTAYCFSTPIYNIKTRTLVQTNFITSKVGTSFKGTNGLVSVNQNRSSSLLTTSAVYATIIHTMPMVM